MSLDRLVIGWKDTRETRRAVADALPFLKKAEHVAIAEIADETDRADALKRAQDVMVWLGRHGAKAEALSRLSKGGTPPPASLISRRGKTPMLSLRAPVGIAD